MGGRWRLRRVWGRSCKATVPCKSQVSVCSRGQTSVQVGYLVQTLKVKLPKRLGKGGIAAIYLFHRQSTVVRR